MKKIMQVEEQLKKLAPPHSAGISTQQLADQLALDRSTVSRYLNQLVAEKKALKRPGKPIRYCYQPTESNLLTYFPHLIDFASVEPQVKKGLAALMYPPHGLPILITGETGVGKSFLAKSLFEAWQKLHPESNKAFVAFNCAEYAHNPELLMGQLFGIRRGAFTGATDDRTGLVERADQGVLFLDEIHRLPPSGQEMLFQLLDRGTYRRLGETENDRKAHVRLIAATTEKSDEAILPTLYRRFTVKLELPPLRTRSYISRQQYVDYFLTQEQQKLPYSVKLTDQGREVLIKYECPGNIGQLQSDIRLACANAFLRAQQQGQQLIVITEQDLPQSVHLPLPSSGLHRQRLLAIVCLAGEGAAPSIAHWLRNYLHSKDSDVLIRAVQLDPKTRQSADLERLKKKYDLIAIVGTVPPAHSDEVPYLSVFELYQPEGFQRLEQLLSATRPVHPRRSSTQIAQLVQKGLSETVSHFNPQRFVLCLQTAMEPLRQHFQWDEERELGIWMHLGIYTDRLLAEQLTPSSKRSTPPEGEPPLSTPIHLWQQVLKRLEEQFKVIYPPSAVQELTRLSQTQP